MKTKSRPKAASQFRPDDRGSGGHQCWLCLPTTRHEADACEADQLELTGLEYGSI